MTFAIDEKGTCQIEGVKYPAVGFGTYPLKDETCYNAVIEAAELGYRIIDTATFYKNFTPIGNALKKLGRNKFYIISKVWHDAQTPEKIHQDIEMTLAQLQTKYLDAYLVHWPNRQIAIEATLQAMENLRTAGIIRHIGLSNVTVHHLQRALESQIPIAWVQVEMHPFFYDAELLKLCQQQAITLQAWTPLARGRLYDDVLLNRLGKKYAKTVAQISLKWIIQHQCLPLPGSKNANHMRENLDIADFMLSPEDMEAIDSRAKTGKRVRITEANGLGFADEFDFSYAECWPNHAHESI